jgi:glycosyltransferase involved in cell wall biosynthesis
VHILYFADIRFPLERANGIQTMETCHALAERGHDVRLIVRPDTHVPARDPFAFYGLPPSSRLAIERAPVAGPDRARRLGYLAFAMGRGLGRLRADIVFTRDLGVAALMLRMPPAMRPPVVYESHGYAPDVAAALPDLVATAGPPGVAKLGRLRRREARVWRAADGYVTITSGLAQEMAARFGPRAEMAVVPDGARVPAVAPPRPPARGRPRPVVAYAGHLYRWKGVDVLLEALARLPGVRGLVVGGHEKEPDLARMKMAAEELGIAGRVTFTGWVPPADIPALLAGADVLVLPNPASAISTRFTSPLKLFEYMAARRPIVASDLPAIGEVLQHDRTALLVKPGDPDALAAGVQRLLDDTALGEALADAAFADVAEYAWDRRAAQLEACFQRVIDTRR